MNAFEDLKKKRRQLAFAEAYVNMRPSIEGYKELCAFKKELKQEKRLLVAQ